MSAGMITVDFDLLGHHKRRLFVIADDVNRARQAAASVNLSGGAFGLMCTPLLVPGISVVEVAARNAIGDASRLVEKTAEATGALASDYQDMEQSALDAIRSLGGELDIDMASTYGLRGARPSPSGGGSTRGASFGINPLVAGPVDLTSPLSGTFLLEDGQALVDAIKNQDWLSGGMAAFATVVDTVAMLSDPVGQLFAMGFGWLLDHIEPLKGWLNDLSGDPGEVAGFAQTWKNIETQLTESGLELDRATASNFADMHGAGIDAAIVFHRDLATHLGAAGRWAGAMGTGLEISSTIVQIVHDITRDAIAEVAGAICSYVLEAVFTLGAATPLIIEQASTKAFAIATRIGRHIDKLKTALKNLRQLLDKLGKMFNELGTTFRGALNSTRGKAVSARTGDIDSGVRTPHQPKVAPQTLDEIDGWVKSINPNYTGFPGDDFSENCGKCSESVFGKLEGGPVNEAGVGTYSIPEMEAITGVPQVPMTTDEIAGELIRGGQGSHAVVGIDRADDVGHWFNAYYDGTKVVAIDGQTGQVIPWPPSFGATNWDAAIVRKNG